MTFVTERMPPDGRVSRCDGPLERHLTEAAVMLAVAQWLFASGAGTVQVHPDGVHAKHFDMRGWLENAGFEKVSAKGTTREAGRYTRNRQCLLVDFRPGRGDVVASVDGRRVVVEAKASTRAIRDRSRSCANTSTRRSACCSTAMTVRIA